MLRIILIFSGVVFGARSTFAQIELPHLLGDHAVLQRRQPIHLWGKAPANDLVKVYLHKQSAETKSNSYGRWELWLSPEEAGGPFTLLVQETIGKSSIELHDIWLGDVWVASGQSNMEFPMEGYPGAPLKDGAREMARASQPLLHLFHVGRRASAEPEGDVSSQWAIASPKTVKDFSAIAFFFGVNISTAEHVAIGIIESAWGGTPIRSWVSPTLWQNLKWQCDARTTQMSHSLSAELTEPKSSNWAPNSLYNGMIAPLTPYGIMGIIWYQGEADSSAERAKNYEVLFPSLIADWRKDWGLGRLPFIFVQISGYRNASYGNPAENVGALRNAQRRAEDIANVGMVVSQDLGVIGNNHPPDKQTVAARLALLARSIAYRETIASCSPQPFKVTREQSTLRVWLRHAELLHETDDGLSEVQIAGNDKIFKEARAKLEHDSILANSDEVSEPVYVRFGWSPFPKGSIKNGIGLPLGTFEMSLCDSGSLLVSGCVDSQTHPAPN